MRRTIVIRILLSILYYSACQEDPFNPLVKLGLRVEISAIRKPPLFYCSYSYGTNYNSEDTTQLSLLSRPVYQQKDIEFLSTLPGYQRNFTYSPKKVKELFFNINYEVHSHVELLYACHPPDMKVFEKEHVVDYLLMMPYATFTTIDCNPCSGTMSSSLFYGKVKLFPVDAHILYRSLSIQIYQLELMKKKNDYPIADYNIIDIGEVYEKFQISDLVINCVPFLDSGPRHYNFVRYNRFDDKIIILLNSQEYYYNKDIFRITLSLRKNVIPAFQPILDDILFIDYKIYPYEKVQFIRNGEFDILKAYGHIYYMSYGYSGLHTQFRCQHSFPESRFRKCKDSSISVCSNKYRKGIGCQLDRSICQQNPCKYNGTCTNGTNTNYQCICSPNTYGKNCEFFTCTKHCSNGRCIGPNVCGDCHGGFTGVGCKEITCDGYFKCVTGNCTIINNERKCICDPERTTGQYCQMECSSLCKRGVCTYFEGKSMCLCEDGYEGNDCSVLIKHIKTKSISRSTIFIVSITIYSALGLIVIITIFALQIHLFGSIGKSGAYWMSHTKNFTTGPANKYLQESNAEQLGPNLNDGNPMYEAYEDLSKSKAQTAARMIQDGNSMSQTILQESRIGETYPGGIDYNYDNALYEEYLYSNQGNEYLQGYEDYDYPDSDLCLDQSQNAQYESGRADEGNNYYYEG